MPPNTGTEPPSVETAEKACPGRTTLRRLTGNVTVYKYFHLKSKTCFECRAVAPNARENHDAAERRRQMIQESKYLGGDMEHTHLVKGLDFALLQKVKIYSTLVKKG